MNELDDEIDLKHYIRVLQQSWRLILGLLVVTTAVAAGVRLIVPRLYTASTLVSVGQPAYAVRLQDVNQDPALLPRSYQDLAVSDDVVADVLSQVQAQFPNRQLARADLRTEMSAGSGSDPTLMRLAVTDSDPTRAAAIANIWAEAVAKRAALLFGPETTQLDRYKSQLADAKVALGQADKALTTFQAQNQAAVIGAQLASQQSSLTDYLDREHRFTVLDQDAQDLLARLQRQDPQQPASITDETALLLLMAQTVSTNSSGSGPDNTGSGSTPIQIQIGNNPASGQSVGQLIGTVQAYIDALRARSSDAQVQAEKLIPSIVALQGKKAEAVQVFDELSRTQSLAEKQYVSLSEQVSQVQIAAQDAANVIKIVSHAAVPQVPSDIGLRVILPAGAIAGLLVGMLVALSWDWLRQSDRSTQATQPAPQPDA